MKEIRSLPSSVDALFREVEAQRSLVRAEATPPPPKLEEQIRLAQSQTGLVIAQQNPELAAGLFAIQTGSNGIETKEVHHEHYMVEREVNFLGVKLGTKYVPAIRTTTITRTIRKI